MLFPSNLITIAKLQSLLSAAHKLKSNPDRKKGKIKHVGNY